MKLRCPAIPLITHTPYFSVWSPDDVPNRTDTCHWTGRPQPITGTVKVGDMTYDFLGQNTVPPMRTEFVGKQRNEICFGIDFLQGLTSCFLFSPFSEC